VLSKVEAGAGGEAKPPFSSRLCEPLFSACNPRERSKPSSTRGIASDGVAALPVRITSPPDAITRLSDAITRPPDAITSLTDAITRPPDAITSPPDAITRLSDAITSLTDAIAAPPASIDFFQ